MSHIDTFDGKEYGGVLSHCLKFRVVVLHEVSKAEQSQDTRASKVSSGVHALESNTFPQITFQPITDDRFEQFLSSKEFLE